MYQSLAFGQPTYLSSVLTSHQASDVFLTTSATAYRKHILHGQETVSIYIANLHAIFNDILRKKNHGTLLYCGCSTALWQWASLSWGMFLNSVRLMGSTPFKDFHFKWFSVLLDITLECSWVIGFCLILVEYTLPRQSPIANRVLHKHQRIDVIDRHVMIFWPLISERHQWLTLTSPH